MDYSALTADEQDLEAQALVDELRARQRGQAQQRTQLQQNLGRQQGQAGNLRSLALLSSLGDNSLLRGVQQEASQQGQQMDSLAARTEGRLANLGGGMDPLSGIIKLRGLGQAAAKEAGIQDRFNRGHAQRGEQFAKRLGLDYAKMSQDERQFYDNLAAQVAAREAAAAGKTQENLDNQTKDFGGKVADSGLPEFETQYSAADAILTKFKGKSDLPGVGPADGRMSDLLTSDDGKQLRYALNQMKLAYQKSITGAGASDSERAAIAKATGLMDTNDPASIRLGVKMMKDVMDAKRAALEAGYKPEAVETYKTRLKKPGAPTAAPPGKAAAGEAAPARPDKKLDPKKTEERRTYSKDGKWMKVFYTDGTYGLAPSDRR